MINRELKELLRSYARELRESKDAAERWWTALQVQYAGTRGSTPPEELWPLGPASHPWVIRTYRKYFFLCVESNSKTKERESQKQETASAGDTGWGSDDDQNLIVTTVEPKVFVLDMLSGGDTNDLYEFLLSLVLVPIGLKNDEFV